MSLFSSGKPTLHGQGSPAHRRLMASLRGGESSSTLVENLRTHPLTFVVGILGLTVLLAAKTVLMRARIEEDSHNTR